MFFSFSDNCVFFNFRHSFNANIVSLWILFIFKHGTFLLLTISILVLLPKWIRMWPYTRLCIGILYEWIYILFCESYAHSTLKAMCNKRIRKNEMENRSNNNINNYLTQNFLMVLFGSFKHHILVEKLLAHFIRTSFIWFHSYSAYCCATYTIFYIYI